MLQVACPELSNGRVIRIVDPSERVTDPLGVTLLVGVTLTLKVNGVPTVALPRLEVNMSVVVVSQGLIVWFRAGEVPASVLVSPA